MRVYISGHSGFVGQHVIAALKDDHDLVMPGRDEVDLLHGTMHQPPLEDLACFLQSRKIDAVVHLAATVAGLPGNIGNQGLFMYDNLQMALNIFEAARLADVSKIINLGSVCGYHDVGPKPFQEDNFWLGLPHESNRGYGMAKRASIMLGVEYERQYKMDITNLIPINLVGEYDQSDHVVMDLIKKFEDPRYRLEDFDGVSTHLKKYVELWGTGSATREFCYAGDLARAIAISLERKTGAWPINIGTGKEISIKDLAELIKKIGNYNIDIEWDSTKPEGQASRCLDITRARNILRWEPRVSLEDAIGRTIKWYRKCKH